MNALALQVLKKNDGWFINFNKTSDFGIDVQANLMKPDEEKERKKLFMTNKGVSFQLKAGSSYKRVRKCDSTQYICAKFTNDLKKLRNWMKIWFKNPFPVYIVWLPDPDEDPRKAYWISLMSYIGQNPEFPSDDELIFRFPLENEFNRAKMSNIRKIIIQDKVGRNTRELLKNSFLKIDELLTDFEKDRFESSDFKDLIETIEDVEELNLDGILGEEDQIMVSDINLGERTNFPKNVSSPILLTDADFKYKILAEENFIINTILERASTQQTTEEGLKEFIQKIQEGKYKQFSKVITTPIGKKHLANERLMEMGDNALFLKSTQLKIISLVGKLDEIFGTFFIFLNDNIIGRRSIKRSDAKLRTFDPNNRLPFLSGINTEENYELEYHHLLTYIFFLERIENIYILMFNEE